MKSVFHCFFSFLPELEPRHNERVASVFPLESRQLGLIPHVRNCFEAVDAGGFQSPIPIRTMSEVICHQFYPEGKKVRETAQLVEHHYAAAIPAAATLWELSTLCLKQVAQRTGLFCVGLNGTVVWLPHAAHVTGVSTRRSLLPLVAESLFALHSLQCFGSLTNPFSR